MCHRFLSYKECEEFVKPYIGSMERVEGYLTSLPKDYRDYLINTTAVGNMDYALHLTRMLLCGEISAVITWYIYDRVDDKGLFEHRIMDGVIQEVEIKSMEQLLKFIETEFFTDKE